VYNNKLREIRHVYDNNLQKIALVPLDDSLTPKYATILEDTFWELITAGCADSWYENKDKKPFVYISSLKNTVSVARLITKAGANERVFAVDGDNFNLRTNNLCIANSTKSKRREWDYLCLNTHDSKPRCKHIWEYPFDSHWQRGVSQVHAARQEQQLAQDQISRMNRLFAGVGSGVM
jgi:hypothetical protein